MVVGGTRFIWLLLVGCATLDQTSALKPFCLSSWGCGKSSGTKKKNKNQNNSRPAPMPTDPSFDCEFRQDGSLDNFDDQHEAQPHRTGKGHMHGIDDAHDDDDNLYNCEYDDRSTGRNYPKSEQTLRERNISNKNSHNNSLRNGGESENSRSYDAFADTSDGDDTCNGHNSQSRANENRVGNGFSSSQQQPPPPPQFQPQQQQQPQQRQQQIQLPGVFVDVTEETQMREREEAMKEICAGLHGIEDSFLTLKKLLKEQKEGIDMFGGNIDQANDRAKAGLQDIKRGDDLLKHPFTATFRPYKNPEE